MSNEANEELEEARRRLAEILEGGDEEIGKHLIPMVIFNSQQEGQITQVYDLIVELFNKKRVPIGLGIMAMMVMANNHLDAAEDEDAANKTRQICMSILTGNYEFKGDVH